jgi:predicted ferric reductase
MIKPRHFDRYFWGTLWILGQIGLFAFAYFKEVKRGDNKANVRIFGIYLYIARGAARCLNFNMAMILIPICRNFLTLLRRVPFLDTIIPFDKHLRFHKVIAWSIVFFTAVHTVAHYMNFRKFATKAKSLSEQQLNWTTWGGTTGTIMIAVLALMVTSAADSIRKQAFELFWYTHHLWTVLFFAILTHTQSCILKTDTNECYDKSSWEYVMLGLIIYSIELCLRWYRGFFQTTVIKKVIKYPSNVFEIQFYKNSMKINPGQYVFVNVPEISNTEWHPFTLTSCAEEGFHSVHIRAVGDWTTSLAKRLGCMDEYGSWDSKQGSDEGTGEKSTLITLGKTVSHKTLPRIRVDGPFGTPSTNVLDNHVALLVGAGIGITPFVSILKSIWYARRAPSHPLKLQRVYLIWIARDATTFEWFQDVLKNMEADNGRDAFLRIRVYLTGQLDSKVVTNVMVNSVATSNDVITGLEAKTYYGRPNLDEVFQKVRLEALHSAGGGKTPKESAQERSVGVFYCGPGKLGHQLRVHSHKHSNSKVKFRFSKEIF